MGVRPVRRGKPRTTGPVAPCAAKAQGCGKFGFRAVSAAKGIPIKRLRSHGDGKPLRYRRKGPFPRSELGFDLSSASCVALPNKMACNTPLFRT